MIRMALKSLLLVAAVALVVGVATFAWMKLSPRRVPPGQPPLAKLDSSSLPAFRATFNAAGDEIRVLAMLSPT